MRKITRDQLKQIFRKVKKLRLPDDLEERDFENLKYLGWIDQSDQVCYLAFEYKGKLEGLRLDFLRSSKKPLQKGFCDFCHKHRDKNETIFISTKTKKTPKGVNCRVRGLYICSDFEQCNRDLKDDKTVKDFFYRIIEED